MAGDIDKDMAPETVISCDKEKNAESNAPTQTGVNGSGTKTPHRPRGPRNRKSKKNHEFPLLCEFMEMACKMESLLDGVKKQGKSLFGNNVGNLRKHGDSVPGKSPDGGPSRKERRRLEHGKKIQHESFIGTVLKSVIAGNVPPD